MKITYNYNQKFEIVEIDMYEYKVIVKTNNGMGMFENESKEAEIIFEIPFNDMYDISNIPKLLWDYLKENRLIYLCD